MLSSRSVSSNASIDTNNAIVFQALSWSADDHCDSSEEEDKYTASYLIHIFGVNKEGQTVSVLVKDFTPYFYIKVDDSWGSRELTLFKTFIIENLEHSKFSTDKVNCTLLQKKDFWGFTNFHRFKFVRLSFGDYKSLRKVSYLLGDKINIPGLRRDMRFRLYESNIEPFLRFMHIRDLNPSGWIQLPSGSYKPRSDTEISTNCNINVEVHWTKVVPFESDDSAPFLVASFDIECTSFTGEFPMPRKDYSKLANEIHSIYTDHLKADVECTSKLLGLLNYAFGITTDNPENFHITRLNLGPHDKNKLRTMIIHYVDNIFNILQKQGCKDVVTNSLSEFFTANNFPAILGDEIIQIGTTFHVYGQTECIYKHIITLKGCDDIPGVEVQRCETEKELLLCWKELIRSTNPDVITGYNIIGFDMWYLVERAKELGCYEEFMKIGRFNDKVCKWQEKRLSSAGLGDNFLKYIDIDGIVIIDLMKIILRDHKLVSYKLDFVASTFLKLNKNDVGPQQIFKLFKGSDADRKVIAEYCVQDCTLCNFLMMKLEVLATNIGMSNVCVVPLSYILLRGQGIKIFSLVLKECKNEGYLIPTIKAKFGAGGDGEEDSYEGAIVLEPKRGMYIDSPVSVLDYASLYPASMISENLSHDCIVLDPKYDNLPGVEYLDIMYDVEDATTNAVYKKMCRYVQLKEKGIIPKILLKLLTARKTTRKKIETKVVELINGEKFVGLLGGASDGSDIIKIGNTSVPKNELKHITDYYSPFQKNVLDGLQNAYKVTANSLYGQIGAKTSPIYLKDIAACTTATGRKMIMEAKEFLETNYKADVIYGDSVPAYTPCLINVDGVSTFDTIENVASKYGISRKWYASSVDPGNANNVKEYCEMDDDDVMVWTEKGWTPIKRIIRHELAVSKRIMRITTTAGIVDCTDDHSLLLSCGLPVSPKQLNIGDCLMNKALPKSLYNDYNILLVNEILGVDVTQAAGDIKAPQTNKFRIEIYNNQLHAALVYAIMTMMGYHPIIEAIDEYVYRITIGSSYDQERAKVIKIEDITSSFSGRTYVYDMTTENHHFAAGIGRLIVHNTDSIFAIFPVTSINEHGETVPVKGKEAIRQSIDMSIQASIAFKKMLKPPHDLEYDKTFWPFIILSKKRYVGNLYEMDENHYSQKSMGIVLKRRDNAHIVKKIYGGIIDIILNKQDIAASVGFLKEHLNMMVNGTIDIQDLVISKSLKADYKQPDKIAHKVLAERMGKRDPGNKPQINDRIPYVYIMTKNNNALQGERIESPDYIKANKIKPDYEFYITNQIMNPVLQLFSVVIDKIPDHHLSEKYYTAIYDKYYEKYGDKKKASDKVDEIKEIKVKEMLFDPYLNILKRKKMGMRDIKTFFTKAPAPAPANP